MSGRRNIRFLRFIVIAGIILVWGAGKAEAQADARGLVYFTPEEAKSLLRSNWLELQRLIADPGVPLSDKRTKFSQLLENKHNGAIGELPVYSVSLLVSAQSSYQRGDIETAMFLVSAAEELSPDSVLVQLALARYYLGGGQFSVSRALNHYFKALDSLSDDFPFLYRGLGRLYLLPIGFAAVFGAVFGLFLLIRYFPLLSHDFGDRFPAGLLPGWMRLLLTLVLCLLPLSAGLSFWWLLAWWMVLFSLYMTRAELFGALVFLLLMLSFPWLVEQYCLMAGTRADSTLQAALRVKNGVSRPSDLDLLQRASAADPDELLVRFSLAQLSIRENEFDGVEGALDLYGPCLEHPLTAAAAYNNLAEIHLAAQDYDKVYEFLTQGLAADSTIPELHFNLGKYYLAMGQVGRQKEAFDSARSLDPDRFERFLSRHSEAWVLNRFFIPLSAPRSLFWSRSFEPSSLETALAQATWGQWFGFGPRPGPVYLGAAGGLVAALLVLSWVRGRWRLAFRCKSCGKPICLRCQRSLREPGMCEACYSVFRAHSGLDLKVKMQKRAAVQRHRDLWTRAGSALSLVLPGAGHLLLGFSGIGLGLFFLTSLILGGLVSGLLMWPGPGPVYGGGFSGAGILMILVYLLLMLISFFSVRSLAEEWR